MATNLIVSEEVRRRLGQEIIDANRAVIATQPYPCQRCRQEIPADLGEPVALSAITFAPSDDGPSEVRLIVTHARCSPSRVISLDVPAAAIPESPPPPMIGLLRPAGARAVAFWEPGGVLWSGDGREPVDVYLLDCLERGLQLVAEPVLQFDRPAARGWRVDVGRDGGVSVTDGRGRSIIVDGPMAAWPPWCEAIAEQRRCLVLTGTAVTGAYLGESGRGPDPELILAKLEEARLAGRLVGGVVPARIVQKRFRQRASRSSPSR